MSGIPFGSRNGGEMNPLEKTKPARPNTGEKNKRGAALPLAGRPLRAANAQRARSIQEIQNAVSQARRQGQSIGFVPTMGYFHEGHLSLMRAARRDCGIVVVSIYVNPAQFGSGEDLGLYPRDLERDMRIASAEHIDVVFTPEDSVMYPDGYETFVDTGTVSETLCGSSRPDHFQGVATIIVKMLNIMRPDIAYFGQKDAQQVAVIKQVNRDLNLGAEIRVCPTVRGPDGLALSSRNAYLSEAERSEAKALYKALLRAAAAVAEGERDVSRLINLIEETINEGPLLKIEYAEIVDSKTMQPVEKINNTTLAALAVRAGKTRLIDNMPLTPRGGS